MIIILLIIVLFVVCALIISGRDSEQYEEWERTEGWKYRDKD